MQPGLGDHALVLPGGRSIGYTLYGDPGGSPVLNCHAGLVSGHDVGPADADARELGLCIISPDRPGIGRTDRLAGYDMLAWVGVDAIPLLEHLGVGSLAVMGWSEGGQYALAAAYALPERVTSCAVIAGCPPLDEPGNFEDLDGLDRALVELSRRAPLLARSWFALVRSLCEIAPSVLLRGSLRGLPRADIEAVTELGGWLPALLGEGARDPRGGVDEYLALCAPWSFAPEDISVPVRIFQGTADTLVPQRWAQQLVRRIPGSSVSWFPGEGHFIGVTRRRAVLEFLAAAEPHDAASPPE